jgi:hypothetical protein
MVNNNTAESDERLKALVETAAFRSKMNSSGGRPNFPPAQHVHSTDVGHCIYCGSVDNLTKEHIIPSGAGGFYTLIGGSCGACADITKKFEQDCLQRWFGPLRVRLGLASHRRPKAKRPTSIKLSTVKRFTGQPTSRVLDRNDHPTPLTGVVFDHPGILTGSRPTYYRGDFCVALNMDHAKEQIPSDELLALDVPHPHSLCRTLAKVAYGFSIRSGLEGLFKPLVIDLILGKEGEIGTYLVGGQTVVPPPEKGQNFHWVQAHALKSSDTIYLVKGVRLFAVLGAPVYYVVVGIIPDMSLMPPALPLCLFEKWDDPWTKGFRVIDPRGSASIASSPNR